MLFNVDIQGGEFPAGTVAVFGVKNAKRTVLSKVFTIVDNRVVVRLTNADTRNLPTGKYNWDIRIVTDPEYDEEGNVRAEDDSDDVISIFSGSMPLFEIVEVVIDV
jgi:hypothetical protein